ncbi:VOC family protein [Streptomyces sp. SAS_270]|uniref:VOC family protein n=1 Tax=Streptomyces sp. SAS_270 TaxID=3412748 RepID=UPI00403D2BC5
MSSRTAQQTSGLGKLAVALGVLALASATLGISLLNIGQPSDTPTELGKWLLQLASVFAGTGVVSSALRQADLARAQREAWAELLQDLITAHDKVQLAVRMLSAHATAKTYSDQVQHVSEVREVLRRIMSSPQVHEDMSLRVALGRMRKDLKYLVKEYEGNYLPVARQQRLDEEYLTYKLKTLIQGGADISPLIPDSLTRPLPAWQKLNNSSEFPRLNAFLNGYKASDFRRAYETAKPILERNAGIRRRPKSGNLEDSSLDDKKVLARARLTIRLPAQDLVRAQRFYSKQLDLEPVDARPDGLLYRCGGVEFLLVQSEGVSRGKFPLMAWEVDDIEPVVSQLKGRGAVFEEVEMSAPLGGARTTNEIFEVGKNYPGAGARGARGACFRDSEGNMVALYSPVV